jgi:histidine triad (HIT) family protein
MSSIFSRIIAGEIPAEIVYQDALVTAFKDIHPLTPVHILIVPNREIATADDVTADDEPALGRLFTVAQKLARDMGIGESGYRLIVNCKGDGGQEVFHLHMHLLGGRKLGRMLSSKED